MNKVSVIEYVGPLAITTEDGEKLFQLLEKALSQGIAIDLDFEGVTTLTSVFLNAAIGHLYSGLSEEVVQSKLTFTGLAEEDRELVALVTERAKEFYADPAVRQALEEAEAEENA
jgi:hypothetical protein